MKKKPTAKQIAARKKFVEAVRAGKFKKRRKNPAKKKPTKRLVKRRKSNTKKGYSPNPLRYVAYARKGKTGIKYWFTGDGFDSEKSLARTYASVESLKKAVMPWAKKLPNLYGLYSDTVK